MTITQKLGQLWTDAVAYVALLSGAGLSIAGNVANVARTRGVDMDTLDVFLAVAFPALVVLMVEVFVSKRWRGLPWPMHVLRWIGSLAIGGVAMRVSWTHLHDLMLTRGQTKDVATLGPLAIDALAIMATALILAGRGQARPVQPVDAAADILSRRQEEMDKLAAATSVVQPNPVQAMAESEAAFREQVDTLSTDALPPTAEDTQDLSNVQDEVDRAITQTGQELASEVDSWLAGLSSRVQATEPTPAVPVVPGGRTAPVSRARVGIADQELIELVTAAREAGALDDADQNRLLAGWYGVSTRTIRRRREVLGLNPTSGPPAS